jgi:hypothetical protein
LGDVSPLAAPLGADPSQAGGDMNSTGHGSIAPRHVLTAVGFAALAGVSLIPLFVERPPVGFIEPADALNHWLGCVFVSAMLLAAIGWRYLSDRQLGVADGVLTLALLATAGAMTLCHWYMVDSQPYPWEWQREHYLGLLNHTYSPPHQFRLLPYGFVRFLEWLTHDWVFSCVAHRWFFNYWLLWAWHRFACLFHSSGRAVLTLLPFVGLYPLSIAYYLGQLTDPLSHTLFVLGFIYIIEDRPLPLAASLGLGMLAKETAVLLVPCFALCWLTKGRTRLLAGALWTLLLGVVAVAAFLAARVPFSWRPGAEEMNGAGLMIGTNLGIGTPKALTTVPLWMNAVHPAVFVLPFVPPIVWNWRTIDVRLRLLAVTLTPLLLVSNVCFGWLYESRNYVPLLPLLTTMALPVRRAPSAPP